MHHLNAEHAVKLGEAIPPPAVRKAASLTLLSAPPSDDRFDDRSMGNANEGWPEISSAQKSCFQGLVCKGEDQGNGGASNNSQT